MPSTAIVFSEPRTIAVRDLALADRQAEDVQVEIEASGISTGTERLLWSGEMPPFPGMGYPLVPGYEAIGRVIDAGEHSSLQQGARVFVPGSNGFREARGLFGASASTLQLPETRLVPVPRKLEDEAVLLALSATAYHAVAISDLLPELIIGHGVLGRLAARITIALGGKPCVWETAEARRHGAQGYEVIDPASEDRRDYQSILDVSGDAAIIDALVPHLARSGEIVLAGFYKEPVSFAFPPVFMREARFRVAAQWQPQDMAAVLELIEQDRLDLQGLLTHRARPADAEAAYRTAFEDADCLKMILDWRAM